MLVISRTYCLMGGCSAPCAESGRTVAPVGIVPDDERGHPVTENAADNRETVGH